MRHLRFLLPLALVLPALVAVRAEDEPPQGFEPLFNGKDLSGWRVNKGGKMEVWGAQDGVLFVNGGGGGWLMTEKQFGDFELRLEFKLPEKGNSGVALRAAMEGDPAFSAGMEIQLLDDPWYKKNYKGLKKTQLTGSIYDIVPPSADATKPAGEWNQMRITARGPKITVELNGTKIVDANLEEYKDRVKEDKERHLAAHPRLLAPRGHLGLQSHDGRVEFRRIYVKELK